MKSQATVKGIIVPPRIRTIQYNPSIGRYEFYRLAFPELVFVYQRRSSVSAGTRQFLHCFVRDEWNYFPFLMMNVLSFGTVCMPDSFFYGHQGETIQSAMDQFWNSSFTREFLRLPIKEGVYIRSLQEWSEMTIRRPDFMERLFDPTFFGSHTDRFDAEKIDWIDRSLRASQG